MKEGDETCKIEQDYFYSTSCVIKLLSYSKDIYLNNNPSQSYSTIYARCVCTTLVVL